jgi:3-hydroxymyristoyl/3-hydroxydecanoyl-(acyl carrier protein) dehydratase
MKFFRPVRPEEKITLRAEKLGQMHDLLQFKVAATVAEALVADGQIILNIASSTKANAE